MIIWKCGAFYVLVVEMNSKKLKQHFQIPFCGLLHGNFLSEEDSYQKLDNGVKHGKAFHEVRIHFPSTH